MTMRKEGILPGVGCLLMLVVFITQMVGCFALMQDYWGWSGFVAVPVMVLLLMLNAGFLISIHAI